MIDFVRSWQPLFEFLLLYSGYALSQYVVLRAGVFSVAPAGFAAIGAYGAAILTMRLGWPPIAAMATAATAGGLLGLLLALPLARLRGVYQAIATLAFVQIVLSLNLYLDDFTGGANGLNGIPKSVGFWTLFIALGVVVYLITSLNASRSGRAANVVRDNEAVASTLGVSVTLHQSVAFGLSGAIAGLFGALDAFHGYALDPNQFGFGLVVAILSYVVLGGRRSVAGPIFGAVFLGLLPEVSRPLADYRMLIYGALLIAVIAWMPRGAVDTLLNLWRQRQLSRPCTSTAPVRVNTQAEPKT
ncbi:branched-chain amino acid ABC transporter permease [Variovorax sp. WS11]|uniref:branched-chain amino acid ABC transporter permease n=1 Tax=Variovorax sp. WS11 TaxID=1105204 RepID=UPI000D0CC395|nr:branched-chain amino acid ABC transporter permease [Variovorax sp. WS11]NDZ17467.1 branched-chain amino acid ABC transporter permease [Variovorax sp. WS11]PSL85998.1 branched-chain amino acid ABC transporter permease [Variovorax sp. WS11]